MCNAGWIWKQDKMVGSQQSELYISRSISHLPSLEVKGRRAAAGPRPVAVGLRVVVAAAGAAAAALGMWLRRFPCNPLRWFLFFPARAPEILLWPSSLTPGRNQHHVEALC